MSEVINKPESQWKSQMRIPTKTPDVAIEAAKQVFGSDFVEAIVVPPPDPKKYGYGYSPDVIIHTNIPVPETEEAHEKIANQITEKMEEIKARKK